jgi:hypothetical protein
MKIIDLPTRLFETGDRVGTPSGPATVLHDELEGIDGHHAGPDSRKEIAEQSFMRDAVIVRLDKPLDGREDMELGRENLVYPLEE